MDEIRWSPAELVADWEEEGAERIWVQVVTQRPLAEVLPVVNACVLEVLDRFDSYVIGTGDVLVYPDGPVVVVEWCDERDVLISWAADLAATLGDHGLSGELRVVDAHGASHWLDDDDNPPVLPTLACAIPVDVEAILADVPRPKAAPGWYVPEAATAAVLDILVPWCLASADGRVRYEHSSQSQDVDPRSVAELLRLALAQRPYNDVKVTSGESVEAFRLFRFDIHGQFTASAAGPARGRAGQVAALERVLTRLAPHLESGLIRLAVPGRFWSQTLNPPIDPPTPPFRRGELDSSLLWEFRHLLGSRVFDAYGVQLLTDAHLAHAHDLSSWDVEPVAPGRHLVRAHDLDAWFGGDQPDADVLDRARADFGDMIITRELLKTEPLPW